MAFLKARTMTAMHCHKTLLEGLEQLLLDKYQEISLTERASLPEESQRKLNDLLHDPGVKSHCKAITDEGLKKTGKWHFV